jgi:DNA-binding NarL/FixJ family response regulator
MRVVLIGPPHDRAHLRAQLDGSVEIVAEFQTLAEAAVSAVRSDAFVLGADVVTATGTGAPNIDRGAVIEEPLTSREVQVLELLAQGLSNKSIASRLGISDQTVKFHVASISGKLGAINRTDAVRRAVRRGLVTL